MDVAKSQDIPEPVAEAAPSYAPTTRVQQLTRNVLNSDVEVIGSLRFSDDLLIDGTVEGDISSEGVLSVGQNAVIRAEINTKSVIIHGKVIGNVTVTDRVELKSTAELVGDIQAASLAIEGGAIFIGHSTVGAPHGRNHRGFRRQEGGFRPCLRSGAGNPCSGQPEHAGY